MGIERDEGQDARRRCGGVAQCPIGGFALAYHGELIESNLHVLFLAPNQCSVRWLLLLGIIISVVVIAAAVVIATGSIGGAQHPISHQRSFTSDTAIAAAATDRIAVTVIAVVVVALVIRLSYYSNTPHIPQTRLSVMIDFAHRHSHGIFCQSLFKECLFSLFIGIGRIGSSSSIGSSIGSSSIGCTMMMRRRRTRNAAFLVVVLVLVILLRFVTLCGFDTAIAVVGYIMGLLYRCCCCWCRRVRTHCRAAKHRE